MTTPVPASMEPACCSTGWARRLPPDAELSRTRPHGPGPARAARRELEKNFSARRRGSRLARCVVAIHRHHLHPEAKQREAMMRAISWSRTWVAVAIMMATVALSTTAHAQALSLELIASGLPSPVGLRNAGGGPDRIFLRNQ